MFVVRISNEIFKAGSVTISLALWKSLEAAIRSFYRQTPEPTAPVLASLTSNVWRMGGIVIQDSCTLLYCRFRWWGGHVAVWRAQAENHRLHACGDHTCTTKSKRSAPTLPSYIVHSTTNISFTWRYSIATPKRPTFPSFCAIIHIFTQLVWV